MGNKRTQDQWRDDSNSSHAKRCRSCHSQKNGPIDDGMPPREGLSEIVCSALIDLRDAMQVKISTEDRYKRNFQKLKEKRKKDKKKHEEDLRLLKEDLIRIFKEDHQELKSKIQEMQKEVYAGVNHYKASPSQRSQLSQPTRFRLVIENSVSRTIYKKEPVETEDGGGHIKVVMYDGSNPIAADHPLASVRVHLVLIEGWFNEPNRDSWSKEEFEESIIKPRKGITRLVKNGTFDLVDGRCDHEGAIIMDNSQQREVKLGLRITLHTEIRVLEGVSNPFKVQEGKTKKTTTNKKVKKPSPPVPVGNLVHATSTNATQHGQGPITPDAQQGQALNGNGQQSCQQILTQLSCVPTSTHSMQHGQNYSLPSTSIQNTLQAPGFYQQDQCPTFRDASSQLAFPDLCMPLNDIYQLDFTLAELGLPQGTVEISAGDVHNLTQSQQNYVDGSFRCGQVLLQWNKPHAELKEHMNFLDQLMPLYRTHSRFSKESFPTMSLMYKANKLLDSISSADYGLKMIASVTNRAKQTPQRRGILIRPIEPYDPDDEPPVKKQRNAKYKLRFVNRVCSDYYTREQIKSEDGNLLKVALYDENNLVVTSGPLSSASVEVVLLHGDFNAEGHDYWTSEEFGACLVNPQSVEEPPALGGERVLALTDGEADLGNANFQTSSFHARTGKFIMGVEIKNVREESVQEGITSPFLVRVRQGEESSHHRITSLEALIRVTTEFPKRVCGALEGDAAHHRQVRSVLGASRAEDHNKRVWTASDRPPEPSRHDVEWSASSTLLKARKHEVVIEEVNECSTEGSKKMDLELLSMEKGKDADDFAMTVAEPSRPPA